MKKLSSLISVILCIAILTVSFSAAVDVVKLYDKAMDEIDNCTSIDTTLTEKSTYSVNGDKGESKNTVRVKIVYVDRKKVHAELKYTSSDGTTFTRYYKDGYLYENMYGMKARTKIPFEQVLDMTYRFNIANNSDLKASKVTTVDDGYKIAFMVSTPEVDEQIKKDLIAGAKEEGYKNPRASISDLKATIVISKDSHLKYVTQAYSAKVRADNNVSIDFARISTAKINSLNKIKSISFPSDLSSYTTY